MREIGSVTLRLGCRLSLSKSRNVADITKCQGRECESKDECYRFTAEASKWQSWAPFDVCLPESGECENILKMESHELPRQ